MINLFFEESHNIQLKKYLLLVSIISQCNECIRIQVNIYMMDVIPIFSTLSQDNHSDVKSNMFYHFQYILLYTHDNIFSMELTQTHNEVKNI